MRFYQLTQQHLGKTLEDFPFDATDLARFVLRVINGTLPSSLDPVAEEIQMPMVQSQASALMSEIVLLRQQIKFNKEENETLKIENEFLQKRPPAD